MRIFGDNISERKIVEIFFEIKKSKYLSIYL